MLSRIYGTAWAKRGRTRRPLKQIEEGGGATIAGSASRMDLFPLPGRRPVGVLARQGWSIFQQVIAYMRRRLAEDYQEVNAPQIDKALWETSGHWGWYQEHVRGEIGGRQSERQADDPFASRQ